MISPGGFFLYSVYSGAADTSCAGHGGQAAARGARGRQCFQRRRLNWAAMPAPAAVLPLPGPCRSALPCCRTRAGTCRRRCRCRRPAVPPVLGHPLQGGRRAQRLPAAPWIRARAGPGPGRAIRRLATELGRMQARTLFFRPPPAPLAKPANGLTPAPGRRLSGRRETSVSAILARWSPVS